MGTASASAAIPANRSTSLPPGSTDQLNYIRNLPPQSVSEDESEGLLGEDIAPNASEALLAALGSCLAIDIHANAVARRIPIRQLELELEAEINTTAVWGAGDIDPKPIGFEAVRVSVQLDADASRQILDKWLPNNNQLYEATGCRRSRRSPKPPSRAFESISALRRCC